MEKEKKDFLIVDQNDKVGGRVQSDFSNGFIFDKGFQVYLTEYSLGKLFLNYSDLKLCAFEPGAKIYKNSTFYLISDPLKNPSEFYKTFFSPLANLSDKFRILFLKIFLSQFDNNEIINDKDITTKEYLREFGFSIRFIDDFFVPFFGGVFLEKDLSTSSSFFKFVFSKFSNGNVVIPKKGMQEIPNQLYSNIGYEKVILNTKITSLKDNKIQTENGDLIHFNKLVLAGNINQIYSHKIKYNSVKCLYFVCNEKISNDRYIHLFPEDDLINNIVLINNISSDYAPKDVSLLSISLIGNILTSKTLIKTIQKKISKIYKIDIDKIDFLKEYQIDNALPYQSKGYFKKNVTFNKNYLFAGDHTTHSSIEGAMLSGKRVAENLIN